MAKLKIAHIASELSPLAKTGGLADVVNTLAREHEKMGHRVVVFLPYYREVRQMIRVAPSPLLKLPVHLAPGMKEEVAILQTVLPQSKVPVYLVENARAFDRDQLYGTPDGDYPDNSDRFILFCRAVLQAMKEMNESFDIIHCHDWQTALIPAHVRKLYAGEPVFSRCSLVFTVHNMAYQGIFPKETIVRTGLGWGMFKPEQLEYYGKVSFMKAGILYADKITTVSPNYAREIMTPEFGLGMEGLLKTRESDIAGILNGIDEVEWDPATDKNIAAVYSRKNPASKAACRSALMEEMGLPVPGKGRHMLIGMVGRLAEQKGFDLVADAAAKLAKKPVQIVMLGTGERRIQEMIEDMARKYPDRFAARIKYDRALSHRIYAGADAFLMPSRFEPCGLGQLVSLKYGTLPIVRATGGLADTVHQVDIRKKQGNGFAFKAATVDSLVKAVSDAVDCFADEALWKKLANDAMGEDYSWATSAKRYETVYAQCRDKRK